MNNSADHDTTKGIIITKETIENRSVQTTSINNNNNDDSVDNDKEEEVRDDGSASILSNGTVSIVPTIRSGRKRKQTRDTTENTTFSITTTEPVSKKLSQKRTKTLSSSSISSSSSSQTKKDTAESTTIIKKGCRWDLDKDQLRRMSSPLSSTAVMMTLPYGRYCDVYSPIVPGSNGSNDTTTMNYYANLSVIITSIQPSDPKLSESIIEENNDTNPSIVSNNNSPSTTTTATTGIEGNSEPSEITDNATSLSSLSSTTTVPSFPLGAWYPAYIEAIDNRTWLYPNSSSVGYRIRFLPSNEITIVPMEYLRPLSKEYLDYQRNDTEYLQRSENVELEDKTKHQANDAEEE